MILTLSEKKQQWIRWMFRIMILAVDITGLFVCLYLENILAALTGNQEVEGLFINMLRRNQFLLGEFNTAVRVGQCVIFILLAGLCIMIYHLIIHEIQTRARIHHLLYCIGYRSIQVYVYEFIYGLWDLFFGVVLSSIGFAVFFAWVMKMEHVVRVLEALHWNRGRDLFIFFLLIILLFLLNVLCCIFGGDRIR